MKKKDIITLIIAFVVMGASIYFALTFLFPQKSNSKVLQESAKSTVVPVKKEYDQKTIDTVGNLSDYGQPELTGLGKENLFGGF